MALSPKHSVLAVLLFYAAALALPAAGSEPPTTQNKVQITGQSLCTARQRASCAQTDLECLGTDSSQVRSGHVRSRQVNLTPKGSDGTSNLEVSPARTVFLIAGRHVLQLEPSA